MKARRLESAENGRIAYVIDTFGFYLEFSNSGVNITMVEYNRLPNIPFDTEEVEVEYHTIKAMERKEDKLYIFHDYGIFVVVVVHKGNITTYCHPNRDNINQFLRILEHDR